ncbi:hypothetical protein EVAR_78529_1 [Eumeta japonica]|uniref:Uncharacterized protein n=1 Tax=Eumeta variegata TaxID=151549 RepID=A0A4C1W8J4_EUMVA|nr:hypothetical protein EVAR_78529_1 [Eumeta japonica]
MCTGSAYMPGSGVTNDTFQKLRKTEEVIDLFIIAVIAFKEWGILRSSIFGEIPLSSTAVNLNDLTILSAKQDRDADACVAANRPAIGVRRRARRRDGLGRHVCNTAKCH